MGRGGSLWIWRDSRPPGHGGDGAHRGEHIPTLPGELSAGDAPISAGRALPAPHRADGGAGRWGLSQNEGPGLLRHLPLSLRRSTNERAVWNELRRRALLSPGTSRLVEPGGAPARVLQSERELGHDHGDGRNDLRVEPGRVSAVGENR